MHQILEFHLLNNFYISARGTRMRTAKRHSFFLSFLAKIWEHCSVLVLEERTANNSSKLEELLLCLPLSQWKILGWLENSREIFSNTMFLWYWSQCNSLNLFLKYKHNFMLYLNFEHCSSNIKLPDCYYTNIDNSILLIFQITMDHLIISCWIRYNLSLFNLWTIQYQRNYFSAIL